MAPLYLGVKFVIAKSFARIHKANLINSGIIPLTFQNPADYEKLELTDQLEIEKALKQIHNKNLTIKNTTQDYSFEVHGYFTDMEILLLLAGGKINSMKKIK